jgi:alkanesulfonate monooxygenase SsuD/methylene tetrahydromethanopterin reductase-like flavin-dependent oxidoreductase (luciferase family)
MRESARTAALGLLSFDALLAAGAVICGDPDDCVAQLRSIRDRLRLTEFLLFTNLGGIAIDAVHSSIELTAREVVPHIGRLGVGQVPASQTVKRH